MTLSRHLLRPAALAALLAAAPALAQTPEAPNGAPRSGAFIVNDGTLLRASEVIGAKVVGLDHHTLGSVGDLLIDPDGRVAAVVIKSGAVLGFGGKQVAAPFGAFLWNTEGATDSQGRSASLAPSEAPSKEAADRMRPEQMTGARIADEALVSESDPNRAKRETGPVTTSSTRPATVIASEDGEIVNAEARLTKADIDAAPEFKALEGR